MQESPRVALFTDCYYEVNGVGRTSRQLAAYARTQNLPLLAVHAGDGARVWREGSVVHGEFQRGWPSLRLDADMAFDLAFLPRHLSRINEVLLKFRPDVVHITGPCDSGLLGLLLAKRHKLPVLASWHTNLHEYAGQRIPNWLPARSFVARYAEKGSLRLLADFYRCATRTLAPNPELVELVAQITGKPCALMQRGIDAVLFHPGKRSRVDDGTFRIGYVGRLSPEKNVRMLAEIATKLEAMTRQPFAFHIVGQGEEQGYLREHCRRAKLEGVLMGERLSRAYADFDAFVFPSQTDTFGNVVLEALASGVPTLVMNAGGPKFLVQNGENGFVCRDAEEFASSIFRLMELPMERLRMRAAARQSIMSKAWDSVFDKVYAEYAACLKPADLPGQALTSSPSSSATKVSAKPKESVMPEPLTPVRTRTPGSGLAAK